MAYTVLAYSVFTIGMDTKVTPTDDTDYSYHMKQQNLFNHAVIYVGSISHH